MEGAPSGPLIENPLFVFFVVNPATLALLCLKFGRMSQAY